MLPLQGVGVLVTRPEQQSDPLCRILEAHGAGTWRLPVIDIRSVDAGIDTGQAFDLLLFTSTNAVHCGAALLQQHRDLTIGAIGPATARALTCAGYEVAIQPRDRSDSEALLAHQALQQLQGRRVLLVKGRGGRRLLEEELTRRGAQVQRAEVYERIPVEPSPAALARVQAGAARGVLQIVTATSVDIGTRLLEIAPPALRSSFEQLHWLVPTRRVADELRAYGLGAPMLVAGSAEDQDLVSALLSWRGTAPGA